MTPEEEIEAIEIEMELRRRKRERAPASTTTPATPEVASASVTEVEVAPENDDKARWASAGPIDRVKMLLGRFPKESQEQLGGYVDTIVDVGIEAGAPAAGQAIGGATGPFAPVAIPVLGAIGGMVGNATVQARGDEPFSVGQVIGAGITGAIPGANLARAGARQVAREAVKYAASGAISETAESLVDRGELPNVGDVALTATASAAGAPLAKWLSKLPGPSARSAERDMFRMRDDSLKALRSEGVVIPPHEIGEGSDFLSSIGGKAALGQEASRRNAPAWQRLVREELGLSKEALPVSRKDLAALRDQLGAPYRELDVIHQESKNQLNERLGMLAAMPDRREAEILADSTAMRESISILSKWANADVEALKSARASAQRSYDAFRAGNPDAYTAWQTAKNTATQIEQAIEDAAASLGDDRLLSRLRDSRKRIAQTYSVEEALNPATGLVDPAVFGRQLDNKEPLTGNLKRIAEFQLSFNRNAVEATRAPYPNVGNVGAMVATSQVSRGDIPGAVGGIVTATAGRPARAFLLSDYTQNAMLSPTERQNFAAAMARYVAENSPDSRRNSEVAEETVTEETPVR